VKDRRGKVVKSWLRDKTAAFCMIHMGWHPEDCKRLKLPMCEEKEFECTFTGIRKPCLQVNGVATKRPGQKVRNHFACGCEREHDPENFNCEFACVKKLISELGEKRATDSMFWCQREKGYEWSKDQGPQKKQKISESPQRINRREGVRPGKRLTGSMGRKTFVTLGKNFFLWTQDQLKETTHHKSVANLEKYIDPGYVNIGRETMISRVFQSYEQGRYHPPMCGNIMLSVQSTFMELRTIKTLLKRLVDKDRVQNSILLDMIE